MSTSLPVPAPAPRPAITPNARTERPADSSPGFGAALDAARGGVQRGEAPGRALASAQLREEENTKRGRARAEDSAQVAANAAAGPAAVMAPPAPTPNTNSPSPSGQAAAEGQPGVPGRDGLLGSARPGTGAAQASGAPGVTPGTQTPGDTKAAAASQGAADATATKAAADATAAPAGAPQSLDAVLPDPASALIGAVATDPKVMQKSADPGAPGQPDASGTPAAAARAGRGRAEIRPDVPGVSVVKAGGNGPDRNPAPGDPARPSVVEVAGSGLAEAIASRARAEITEMRTASPSHLVGRATHEPAGPAIHAPAQNVSNEKSPEGSARNPDARGEAQRESSGASADGAAVKNASVLATADKPGMALDAARAGSVQNSLQAGDPTRGAAAQAPERTAAAAEIHAPRIIEQLVSQIHVAKLGPETSRATLRLNPESLGQVEVRLEMEGGHLRAHFSAQNADVREALRQHMPELERALAENKVSLSSLQVEVGRGSEGRQEGSMGGRQARMKRASHGPAPAASTGPAPRTESGLDLYA